MGIASPLFLHRLNKFPYIMLSSSSIGCNQGSYMCLTAYVPILVTFWEFNWIKTLFWHNQNIILQVVVGLILSQKFGRDKQLSKCFSALLVTAICLFVAAFGWSWGSLGWIVPSEIFPLETRSAGQAITVSVNLLFTFAIAQAFLSLLRTFKYVIFLFFVGWICIMTVFIYFFLPETKGLPIEEMILLWRKHWFWKKVVPCIDEGAQTVKQPDLWFTCIGVI